MAKRKGLSNPRSTGNAGGNFEIKVGAAFTVLMLCGCSASILPYPGPIHKIKLQEKRHGANIDDLSIFSSRSSSPEPQKILCQVKSFLSITQKNNTLGEVLQAAWDDYNNPEVFKRNRDIIALITGPLTKADMVDTRELLDWSRSRESSQEFFTDVAQAQFSNPAKRAKLEVFRVQLAEANGGKALSDEELHGFLRHFHLICLDLDSPSSFTLSILFALIGMYAPNNAQDLWTRLITAVADINQQGGTINRNNLPVDIAEIFNAPACASILRPELTPPTDIVPSHDLAIACLLGSWDERSEADQQFIGQLASKKYPVWLEAMRQELNRPGSPLKLKSTVWRIPNRKHLWDQVGSHLFSEDLDRLFGCAPNLFQEVNPSFDLPPEERWAATVHNKELRHSKGLRQGMAETLALLGSRAQALPHVPKNRAEDLAFAVVSDVLKNASWQLWGSLNLLLPLFAEAAPVAFLDSLEKALYQTPCPFDELFSQEGSGISGTNYLTGLLWGLEALAWSEEYLARVLLVLAALDERDRGGNWANRPGNSMSTILLPWYPQTLAPIAARCRAMETLILEKPGPAWKLLLQLLPKTHDSSMDTPRPKWRLLVPSDHKVNVTNKEYWEQTIPYAELAVDMAMEEQPRLVELAEHLGDLPPSPSERFLDYLESKAVVGMPEPQRSELWDRLNTLALKHGRFADAKWAMSPDILQRLQSVIEAIAPEDPFLRHRKLFSGADWDFFDDEKDYNEQARLLGNRRVEVIRQLMDQGSLNEVLRFARQVKSPDQVGRALAEADLQGVQAVILPALLDSEEESLRRVASSYAETTCGVKSWPWVDQLDLTDWTPTQVGILLRSFPFSRETWERVERFLGEEESEYWHLIYAFYCEGDTPYVVDKFLEHDRPFSAMHCLYNDKEKDIARISKALLASVENPTEAPGNNAGYIATQLIKTLQKSPNTVPQDLMRIEFAYLKLLNGHRGAYPTTLGKTLAENPDDFCLAIRTIYRSKHEPEEQRKQLSEAQQELATAYWHLLHSWRTPPGTMDDDGFSGKRFTQWLDQVILQCTESGHLAVALNQVGEVLYYAPLDPDGLWMHRTVAAALNRPDGDNLRSGFCIEVRNSRGVHWVDPTGAPERELARQWREKAEAMETNGYPRFSAALRDLADSYDRDAERNIRGDREL